MDDQRHLIRTQAIRIGMTRSEPAPAILDLAGALWRTRLMTDAEEIFSTCCLPEEYVRLDQIELRLGAIPEEDFATEFPARFRARLREELLRHLRQWRAGEDNGGRLRQAGRSSMELLEYLLLHGVMPWWAPQDADFNPALALVESLGRTPRAVAALVARIGRHQRVRSRLVHWLEDPAIATLIRAVAPGEAEFILRYAEDLDARQKEQRLIAAGSAEFRQAKWEVILGHLLADRGSRFNAKDFLRQTLRELAGRFRLGYLELLREFARAAAESGTPWRESSLPDLLGELYAEAMAGPGEPANPPGAQNPKSVETWILVWNDALRERPWSQSASRRAELAFWSELSAGDTRILMRRLLAQHGPVALANCLVEGFSTEEYLQLLRALGAQIPGEITAGESRIQILTEVLAQISRLREEPVDQDGVGAGGDFSLSALRVLLETGALPAAPWARHWRQRTGAWLNLTLARHADSVPPLLRAWARMGRITAAMVAHFPDAVLESVMETLEPAQAEEVIILARATVRGRPETATKAVAWRDAAWQVMFDYLLLDHGSVFNLRSFLASSLQALAARCQVDVMLVWESLVIVAERDGPRRLLNDLRAIRPSGPEGTELAEARPSTEPPSRTFFNEQSMRRSVLVRLRLLQMVLAGAPTVKESWLQGLLPLLWELLAARNEADEPWRELVRQTPADPRMTDLILQTGGARIFEEMFFAGEPAQARLWHEAVSWLERSPAAAGLFPGGRTGLRSQLWHALAKLWREAGGRPIRDAMGFLVRALLQVRGRGGQTGLAEKQSMLETLRLALEQEGTGEATKLAARLPRRNPPQPGSDMPGVPVEEKEEAGQEDDKFAPIKISNAGLVLLCPFFPELYKRCGLLDGGMFRDFQATQRAVHLLQYLVNEGVRTHEYSLVLNKILCGLDPEVAVVPHVKLTDEEQAAGRQMLEYATSHWARGAAISVEGLRASYLRRPGWLKRAEAGWSLRVERRGWDVLLPELSWSFPGPRPAWMPQPLEVDWI